MPHPARCRLRALLGFPLRDSATAAPRAGRRTRGCTLAGGATRIRGVSGNERRRSDELFRPTSQRDPPVGAAGRAAEGGQVAAQGRAGRRALPYDRCC
eukprot:scaffold74165_cov64-Phaeocystis_antarctica.AAC.3